MGSLVPSWNYPYNNSKRSRSSSGNRNSDKGDAKSYRNRYGMVKEIMMSVTKLVNENRLVLIGDWLASTKCLPFYSGWSPLSPAYCGSPHLQGKRKDCWTKWLHWNRFACPFQSEITIAMMMKRIRMKKSTRKIVALWFEKLAQASSICKLVKLGGRGGLISLGFYPISFLLCVEKTINWLYLLWLNTLKR